MMQDLVFVCDMGEEEIVQLRVVLKNKSVTAYVVGMVDGLDVKWKDAINMTVVMGEYNARYSSHLYLILIIIIIIISTIENVKHMEVDISVKWKDVVKKIKAEGYAFLMGVERSAQLRDAKRHV
jgi:hypothetical protein